MKPENFLDRQVREYKMSKILGIGGMGAVLRATHMRLNADRAIKILRSNLTDDAHFKARFEREARILAKLENKHLIRIYEFFEEDNHLFLVMEFVEGESLAQRIDQLEVLEPAEAVNLIQQACTGLAHAHSQGIVHRDLSPDNLMITWNRAGDEIVKVIDFGIAKAESIDNETQTLLAAGLTSPGAFIGKVRYCSPEQAMGKIISSASDQYSLALILYEAITGQPAFGGETPMESLTIRIHEPPPRLSEVRQGASYPTALEDVLAKSMAKDPEDRFDDIIEFRDALGLALQSDTQLTVDKVPGIVSNPDFEEEELGYEEENESPEEVFLVEPIASSDISSDLAGQSSYSKSYEIMHPQPVPKRSQRPTTSTYYRKKRKRWPWIIGILGLWTLSISAYMGLLPPEYRKTFEQKVSNLADTGWVEVLNCVNKVKDKIIVPAVQPTKVPVRKTKHRASSNVKPSDGPFLVSRPGVTRPKILKKVDPDMRYIPSDAKMPVTVVVQTVVLSNGRVGEMDIIRSVNKNVDQIAKETIQKWKFKGGAIYGQPADIILDLKVEFKR